MNVGKSVFKAVQEWQRGDPESAMLHACNAVDGTARKAYPTLGNKERFTKLLRDHYDVLGAMGAPGINLMETRFPVVVRRPTASGGEPDLADVIYAVHRCTHGHGDELPDGFSLLSDAAGPPRVTRMTVQDGSVQLSDRVIFGLVAVAVFASVNANERSPNATLFLTFGATEKMLVNEWWGREADFLKVAAADPSPQVTLDFSEWRKRRGGGYGAG
jgi:hypothetical protein